MNKRYRNRRLFIAIILMTVLILIPSAQARKIKTKHTVTKYTAVSESTEKDASNLTISMDTDSVDFRSRIVPAIRFYGFDKTVTGSQESFFISNALESHVNGMEILITYFDMKGRQLHRRRVSLDCNIPSGETIRTDIKSWDTQKSFYYHRSVKPRRQATPFEVSIELLSVTLIENQYPTQHLP